MNCSPWSVIGKWQHYRGKQKDIPVKTAIEAKKKLKRSHSTTKSVGYEARGRLPQMGFLIHYQQRRKLQQNATIHKGLLC